MLENNSKVYSDEEALKLILGEKCCPKPKESNAEVLIVAGIILGICLLIFYKQLQSSKK